MNLDFSKIKENIDSFFSKKLDLKAAIIGLIIGGVLGVVLAEAIFDHELQISFDSEGKLTINEKPLSSIINELEDEQNNREEIAGFYTNLLANTYLYKLPYIVKYVDNRAGKEHEIDEIQGVIAEASLTSFERELRNHRIFHITDSSLVDELEQLETDEPTIQEISQSVEKFRLFRVEPIMIGIKDTNERSVATVCTNSSFYRKKILISNEKTFADTIQFDANLPINCFDEYDPCEQDKHPLKTEHIDNKFYVQLDRRDFLNLFPKLEGREPKCVIGYARQNLFSTKSVNDIRFTLYINKNIKEQAFEKANQQQKTIHEYPG